MERTGERIVFSVIVPTHNRVQALAHCLAALAQLDYPREQIEILVVDDGGEMTLTETLAPFQSPMAVTLLTQERAGPGAARNAGAVRARGVFLAFTDDDCAPAPGWLRALEFHLNAAPGCAVGGRTLNLLDDNLYAVTSELLIDYLYRYYNPDPNHARFVASNNLALPRACFLELGGFDVSFRRAGGEDRDFCDRWLGRGHRIVYAADAVVQHAHALGLISFVQQHWRYGQGAWRFHRAQARRGLAPVRVEPLYFYRDLLLYPFSQKQRRALGLALLMVTAQEANLAGFLYQAIEARVEK